MASVCADGDYFEVNDDGELTLLPGVQGLRDVLYFKEPGNSQFVRADYSWLARVRVRVQGAGGGAAGAAAGNNLLVAQPGGAGGGYSEALLDVASLGAVESVVVGAGGSAGGANTDGGDGGNSSFGGFVVANGGSGGTAVMSAGDTLVCYSGIAAPLAGTGDWATGGGASGGSLRLSGSQGQSGQGGESRLGHGGFQRSSNGGGGAPRGYGGGAAGAFARDGESEEGTAGANGLVIVELYG
ncbi:hypothetical protein AB0D24_04540 [Streptomyces javensis]|uniref:glycine-rich domain-containing protein n=1 Tax=Streptomyces javensis TaxID=114698 RepID=UPI0033FA71A8